jgi:hypothetical protein
MNPLLLIGALGIGAYLLMSSSSSGAGAAPSPYGGGGGAPSDGGYGGPTTLGQGGSTTPLGPAAVSSSPSTDSGGGYGGPVSSPAPSASPAPTYMTDETLASFPNLATGAGQGMSTYGGESEDASGGFPSASMSGTAAGPALRWDPMSRRWY